MRYSNLLHDGQSGNRLPVGCDFAHQSAPVRRRTQPPIQMVPCVSEWYNC